MSQMEQVNPPPINPPPGMSVEALYMLMMTYFSERDRHYTQQFAAVKENTHDALISAEKAISKSEFATEKRFDNTNEWRGSINDLISTMMPRKEVEASIIRINEQFVEINKRVAVNTNSLASNASRGKTISDGWKVLIGITGILGVIGTLYAVAHGFRV